MVDFNELRRKLNMADKDKLNMDGDDGENEDTPLPPDLDNEDGEGGMSDEDFGNMLINNAEIERVSMEINPPNATWEKATRWDVKRTISTEDRQTGDVDSLGRTYIRVEGVVENLTVNGQTYKPRLTINLSPDKRADRKDPKKYDMAHLLWVRAWEMYIADNGSTPKKFSQFTTYLRDSNYHIRTFKGNQGPLVAELISKTEMKKRTR